MKSDRERWNSRYSDGFEEDPSPDPFLIECSGFLLSGRALDLACGSGGNSIFLARRGYWVDAFDISLVALRKLKKRAAAVNLSIGCAVVDLDYYPLLANSYDLITVFNFFSQKLINSIQLALKCGGLLIYSTFNYNHLSLKPGFGKDYVVPPGGLGQFFTDIEAIVDMEKSGPAGNISRFVGKNGNLKKII
ncbi:MAG: class I SAM-dependent methyltransferase [Desulfomonilaceae bacterium]